MGMNLFRLEKKREENIKVLCLNTEKKENKIDFSLNCGNFDF